jgi:hypothetical protein
MLTRRLLCFLSIKGTYIRACYVLGQEKSEPLNSPPSRSGVLGNTYNAATPDNVQLVESVHNILRAQICWLQLRGGLQDPSSGAVRAEFRLGEEVSGSFIGVK